MLTVLAIANIVELVLLVWFMMQLDIIKDHVFDIHKLHGLPLKSRR